MLYIKLVGLQYITLSLKLLIDHELIITFDIQTDISIVSFFVLLLLLLLLSALCVLDVYIHQAICWENVNLKLISYRGTLAGEIDA